MLFCKSSFFFQAEDGIRDDLVTGVQTCALPIFERRLAHADAKHHLAGLGIGVGEPKLDLSKMMAFKDEGVDGNVKGVEFLLKKNKVDMFHGTGRIAAVGQVEVLGEDGSNRILETKNVVIATGSEVATLPGIAID